jgi:hypothetical protein
MADPKTPVTPATPEIPQEKTLRPGKHAPEHVVLPEEMREEETDPKKVEINKNITS